MLFAYQKVHAAAPTNRRSVTRFVVRCFAEIARVGGAFLVVDIGFQRPILSPIKSKSVEYVESMFVPGNDACIYFSIRVPSIN